MACLRCSGLRVVDEAFLVQIKNTLEEALVSLNPEYEQTQYRIELALLQLAEL